MNTLRENPNTSNMSTSSSPKADENTAAAAPKQPKTPLKKEDLEKIAKQLKHKLSKASIAAKQSLSPLAGVASSPSAHRLSTASPSRTSPLKYMVRKSSSNGILLASSPNGKSPTQMKTPATAFLSSSPLKNSRTANDSDELESPTKTSKNRNGAGGGAAANDAFNSSPIAFRNGIDTAESVQDSEMDVDADEPQMILQSVVPPSTPPRSFAAVLKPSPSLQTTPNSQKKPLSVNTQHNALLRTPTQTSATMHAGGSSNNNNDNEGADLLMYLATSPSPAKHPSSLMGTPRVSTTVTAATPTQGGASASASSAADSSKSQPSGSAAGAPGASSHSHSHSHSHSQSHLHSHSHSRSLSASNNNFIAPAPPLTPKRPITTTARTPQNRLTPSVNLFNANNQHNINAGNLAPGPGNAGGLPSSGLMLTPAGFNMSDYFNFFTPSPGGGSLGHNLNKNFLKTPDFNGAHAQGNSGLNPRQKVDGKMINFDKVGLFGGNSEHKEQ